MMMMMILASFFFFFFFFFHVYLDALDLSCGTWDFFLGNVYSLVVAGGLRS